MSAATAFHRLAGKSEQSWVLDASAATAICLSEAGFDLLPGAPGALHAPFLLRSEVLSAIQGLQWRREISRKLAELAVERLLSSSLQLTGPRELYEEARRLAGALGWAKTYDAEYVALARLTNLPLLTLDQRLARRVQDLVEVQMP